MNRCIAIASHGDPCGAQPLSGKLYCRWHSPDPADIAKHLAESQRGGEAKAWGNMPAGAPLSDLPGVLGLNLATSDGLRDLLAATMRALAQLPLSTRTAHAIAQLAAIQRGVLESSDFERRLAALEQRTQEEPSYG